MCITQYLWGTLNFHLMSKFFRQTSLKPPCIYDSLYAGAAPRGMLAASWCLWLEQKGPPRARPSVHPDPSASPGSPCLLSGHEACRFVHVEPITPGSGKGPSGVHDEVQCKGMNRAGLLLPGRWDRGGSPAPCGSAGPPANGCLM